MSRHNLYFISCVYLFAQGTPLLERYCYRVAYTVYVSYVSQRFYFPVPRITTVVSNRNYIQRCIVTYTVMLNIYMWVYVYYYSFF